MDKQVPVGKTGVVPPFSGTHQSLPVINLAQWEPELCLGAWVHYNNKKISAGRTRGLPAATSEVQASSLPPRTHSSPPRQPRAPARTGRLMGGHSPAGSATLARAAGVALPRRGFGGALPAVTWVASPKGDAHCPRAGLAHPGACAKGVQGSTYHRDAASGCPGEPIQGARWSGGP